MDSLCAMPTAAHLPCLCRPTAGAIPLFTRGTSGSERGAPSCRRWHAAQRACNQRSSWSSHGHPEALPPAARWCQGAGGPPGGFLSLLFPPRDGTAPPGLTPPLHVQGQLLPLLHPFLPSSSFSFSVLKRKAGQSFPGPRTASRSPADQNWPRVQVPAVRKQPVGIPAPLKEAGFAAEDSRMFARLRAGCCGS